MSPQGRRKKAEVSAQATRPGVGCVRVAVIAGTGRFGSALAEAGHHTIIGSRSAERVVNMAAVLGAQTQSAVVVEGALNPHAAHAAEVVLLAVPAPVKRASCSPSPTPAPDGSWWTPASPTTRASPGAGAGRATRRPPASAAGCRARRRWPPPCMPFPPLRHPERFPLGHVLFGAEDQDVRSPLEVLRLDGVPAGGLEVAAALEHLAVLLTKSRRGVDAPGFSRGVIQSPRGRLIPPASAVGWAARSLPWGRVW